MKLIKHTVLAIALSVGMSSVAVQAATPTDASVIELMEVMEMESTMRDMLNPDNGMMKSIMASVLADKDLGDLTDEQKRKVHDIVTRYAEQLTSESADDVVAMTRKSFIRLAKKYYTQEEVSAQVDFYSSDVGKSIMQKQSAFMQEYMTEAMPNIMATMDKKMESIMPNMAEELEAVFEEDE